VSQLPGVGGNPGGIAGVALESAALPIRDQVSAHLAASNGAIPDSQLILLWGGANDVFHQLGVFEASVAAGQPAATAREAALAALATAGTELAGEVRRLVAAGATKVVVPDVPDIAPTPYGQSLPPEGRALPGAMVQTLNQALAAGLDGVAGVQRIDGTYFADALARPAAYGFANTTVPACTYPTPQAPSSLYCSPGTLNAPDADTTFLYADGAHPSGGSHRNFADFVIARIGAAIPR
jgi:outer membrane lipase/esterase